MAKINIEKSFEHVNEIYGNMSKEELLKHLCYFRELAIKRQKLINRNSMYIKSLKAKLRKG